MRNDFHYIRPSLPTMGRDDAQSLLISAFQYGSLDKVLLVAPDVIAFDQEPEFGWGVCLPEPIVVKGFASGTAIVMERDHYEAIRGWTCFWRRP